MSIAFLGCAIGQASGSSAPSSDYKTYVLQALIQLFYPLSDAVGYETIEKIKGYDSKAYYDIGTIETRVNNILSSNSSTSTIESVIHSKIFDYVRERAYNRARIEYKDYCIDEEYAGKIADRIRGEIVALYTSSNELPRGCYKNFIGKALDRKIEQYVTSSSRPVRESQFCSQCDNNFPHAPRVFLSCGHDICVSCAFKLVNLYNPHCPRCKQSIDQADLKLALQRQ